MDGDRLLLCSDGLTGDGDRGPDPGDPGRPSPTAGRGRPAGAGREPRGRRRQHHGGRARRYEAGSDERHGRRGPGRVANRGAAADDRPLGPRRRPVALVLLVGGARRRSRATWTASGTWACPNGQVAIFQGIPAIAARLRPVTRSTGHRDFGRGRRRAARALRRARPTGINADSREDGATRSSSRCARTSRPRASRRRAPARERGIAAPAAVRYARRTGLGAAGRWRSWCRSARSRCRRARAPTGEVPRDLVVVRRVAGAAFAVAGWFAIRRCARGADPVLLPIGGAARRARARDALPALVDRGIRVCGRAGGLAR